MEAGSRWNPRISTRVESEERSDAEAPVPGLGATTATKLVTGKHSFERGGARIEAWESKSDFIWWAPAGQREQVRSIFSLTLHLSTPPPGECFDFMEASVTGTHGQWTRKHMEITRMGKPLSLNAIADKIETKVEFELHGTHGTESYLSGQNVCRYLLPCASTLLETLTNPFSHRMKDCPYSRNRSRSREREIFKREGRCFTCKKKGHKSRDCPDKRYSKRYGRSRSPSYDSRDRRRRRDRSYDSRDKSHSRDRRQRRRRSPSYSDRSRDRRSRSPAERRRRSYSPEDRKRYRSYSKGSRREESKHSYAGRRSGSERRRDSRRHSSEGRYSKGSLASRNNGDVRSNRSRSVNSERIVQKPSEEVNRVVKPSSQEGPSANGEHQKVNPEHKDASKE